MTSYFINNINSCPQTGTVSAYLGTSDPDGWVIADGVARPNSSIYDRLIALVIGTRGGGNYTPPNYKGAFLRGIGTSGINATYIGPTSINSYQTDEIKSHNHAITDTGHSHIMGGEGGIAGSTGNTNRSSTIVYTAPFASSNNYHYTGRSTTGITINSSGSETRPYNFGVNWIIKL